MLKDSEFNIPAFREHLRAATEGDRRVFSIATILRDSIFSALNFLTFSTGTMGQIFE